MWIILTTRLPVGNPPPKLSIFWSTPWPSEKFGREVWCFNCQGRVFRREGRKAKEITWDDLKEVDILWDNGYGSFVGEHEYECNCDETLIQGKEVKALWTNSSIFGKDPNFNGAVKIVHEGRDIRVFPHEFNYITDERMSEIMEAYVLVSEDAPKSALVDYVLDTDQKFLYEFALLEGGTHDIAMQVALGGNIEDGQLTSYEPAGWYRLIPEYQEFFA